MKPEGSVSHLALVQGHLLALVQGHLFNYLMLSSGDRGVLGISLADEPVWFRPTLPCLPL